MSDPEREEWAVLYGEARAACEKARAAIDAIAGWSGSSGNWPLQEASGKINQACDALKETNP